MIGLAALLMLLLLLGVCAVAAQATSLDVNPKRVAPGGAVRVISTHVPANQVGEIQLHSVVHTYPFRADAQGQVSVDIVVPADTALGDHVVKICWENTCHKDAPLRVVSGVAEAPSPTPGATTLPSGAPSDSPTPGTSPRPGSSPTPRSTPTATPRSTPTSTPKSTPTPKPTPSPSPTPTSNPCPTSPSSAYITAAGGSALVPAVTVTGHNFVPGRTVAVTWYFPSSTFETQMTATIQCNGTFTASFTPKPLDIGTGRITATDGVRTAPDLSYSVS